jgi:stalled ribosome rescue protein Dom34
MVYSEAIRHHSSVDRPPDSDSRNAGARYNFYNAVIASLKSVFATGVQSLVVTSSDSSHADAFISHIRKHHAYLVRTIHVASVVGDAGTANAVRALVKTSAFQLAATDVIDQESEDVVRMLDARLYDGTGRFEVLFSLEEIERFLKESSKVEHAAVGHPEYVLMTDAFWASQKGNPRLQRVLDLARNAAVKTRVLRSDSKAGTHVAQLGGLVCVAARRNR